MNRILISTLVLSLGAAPLLAADAPAPAPAAAPAPKVAAKSAKKAAPSDGFKTEEERAFYSYGFKLGQSLAPYGLSEGEAKAISRGLREAAAGKKAAADVAVYLPKLSEIAQKRVAAKASAQKAKGKAYVDKFSKEPGATEITGGGWIKTLAEGTGAVPKLDDTVKVNYRGTFIDGTEFDSSYSRHEPATFVLRGVVPCWTNGVATMKVGGKAKLVCPSEIAYGDQNHGPIPAGSTLVFEIELLDIVKAEAPAPHPSPVAVSTASAPAIKK